MLTRSEALIGKEAVDKLKNSHILIFGLGGVGGICAEALVRSGVGKMSIVDFDEFKSSNLNRQIFSTVGVLGEKKTDAAAKRLREINPDVMIESFDFFWEKGCGKEEIFDGVDYVIDCIDTVSAKVDIIKTAKKRGIPVISCMGTGNKLDLTKLAVADISKTSVCPLARAVRRELRKEGIENVKVVFSVEEPKDVIASRENGHNAPASMIFVPSGAGLLIAEETVKDIISDVYFRG